MDNWLMTIVILGSLAVTIWALIDLVQRQFRDSNTKLIWALIVIFLHGIGGILYLLIGRGQASLPKA